MDYAPSIFISAKTGRRVEKVIHLIDNVYDSYNRRIKTGILNDCMYDATAMVEPPSDREGDLRYIMELRFLQSLLLL